jgi:hypoxanthine phosphoribosyltransferase
MPLKLPSHASPIFAHPSEAEIAGLLDYYGVGWEYEPRTFVLERDLDGRPTVSFAPDFYLPDYDLYLEITTIKPSLINRKNRKIRMLREAYPNTNIKLLSLRDMDALLQKYHMSHANEISARLVRS